jgi:UDP-N-acetylmuramyl pentapeptide phosphotransferase/UDP-N-acetylglucosamine-1-phosphate transferase
MRARMLIDFLSAALAATAAAILMPLVMNARRFGRDDDFDGVQKAHEVLTSRLGGAILIIA